MSNFEVINNDSGKIPVFDPKFEDAEIEVGGAVDLVAGTALAFNATTGTYWPEDSQTAAIANAKAVLAQDLSFSGAGSLENKRILIAGEVNEDKLDFPGNTGADTADTIPSGAADSFRVQLRAYGIILRKGAVLDELDNQ